MTRPRDQTMARSCLTSTPACRLSTEWSRIAFASSENLVAAEQARSTSLCRCNKVSASAYAAVVSLSPANERRCAVRYPGGRPACASRRCRARPTPRESRRVDGTRRLPRSPGRPSRPRSCWRAMREALGAPHGDSPCFRPVSRQIAIERILRSLEQLRRKARDLRHVAGVMHLHIVQLRAVQRRQLAAELLEAAGHFLGPVPEAGVQIRRNQAL